MKILKKIDIGVMNAFSRKIFLKLSVFNEFRMLPGIEALCLEHFAREPGRQFTGRLQFKAPGKLSTWFPGDAL